MKIRLALEKNVTKSCQLEKSVTKIRLAEAQQNKIQASRGKMPQKKQAVANQASMGKMIPKIRLAWEK